MSDGVEGSAQLQGFTFGDQQVRCVIEQGAPWFVAADLCAALEHSDASAAVRALLDDDEWRVVAGRPDSDRILTATPGRGAQSTTLVSESGAYTLMLTSRVPGAVRMRKWLAREVLPALRRTGSYSAPTTVQAPRLVPGPPPDERWHADPAIMRVAALCDVAMRVALDDMPPRATAHQSAVACSKVVQSFVGAFPLAGSDLHAQLAALERAMYGHELAEGQRLLERLHRRALGR